MFRHLIVKIIYITLSLVQYIFTALCLLVTVVTFQENNGEETVTLTYGWYLASISLAIAALATPCYAVDGCLTVKKKADISINKKL
jgi:hypothetical protein